MYFPAEHLLHKLQISAAELSDFEQKGIIKGIPKAGRIFYSSRDISGHVPASWNSAFHDSRPASGRSNEASRLPSEGSVPRKSGIARRRRVLRARTSMKLLCEGPVNLYLLCSVVSKQTRRLERLMPEERIAELITIALRNCADHEFEIQMDGNSPDVIREAAARMFPPARIANAALGSSSDQSDRRQTENAVSAIGGQQATEGRQIHGVSHLYNVATGIHVSAGNGVDSPDSCRKPHDRQGDYSMSNSKRIGTIHLRQLRAFAENLCLQATRHCENQNYVVAHALYGRALEAAQRIDNPEHKENGNALVTRIQKDRQSVYELLRRAYGSPEKALLEKAQKVGR